jgi:hypothetical protein
LAGLCSRRDGLNSLVDLSRGDRDLDLDLGQEAHRIFSAAIDFRVPLLPAVALDFGDRQAVNADSS